MKKIVDFPLSNILVGVHANDDMIAKFLPSSNQLKYVLQNSGPWIAVVAVDGYTARVLLKHASSAASDSQGR